MDLSPNAVMTEIKFYNTDAQTHLHSYTHFAFT